MAKILLIEDNKETVCSVSMWLSNEGHTVAAAETGEEGLERLLIEGFDLALIDWELPGISGLEICRQFRAKNGKTPLIMLTGRSQLTDKIDGLDTGADDYISKPFSLKELSARVKAILRRPAVLVAETLEQAGLKLDPLNHTLFRQGVELEIMPRDFALLEFFMRNPNVVFSADALLQRVWGSDVEAGPDALRTSIKRIRKKIDADSGEANSLIENVPRVGYRFRPR